MDNVQATLAFHVHTGFGVNSVVVEVIDGDDHVFAEEPVLDWPDLDRLAVQFGVPQERMTLDDDARLVLDARQGTS